MAESSLHRFAVAEIDHDKSPVAVYTIIEGADWEKAAQFAFSAARSRVHADKHIATGVFELHEDRVLVSNVHCIATAGYSRLLARMAAGAGSLEASLAVLDGGRS